MNFDELSYRLFRQELGAEIFEIKQSKNPHCIALSGGLDSSCILALYAKTCENLRTYSIGLRKYNEFKKATLVAKNFNVIHKNIQISKKEYEDACKELIKKKGAPLQVPNEALLYLIAKQFKKDIKGKSGFFLSGEFADELFGGYTNILDTIPNMKGDLIDNYMKRISYDKILYAFLTPEEYSKYYKVFERVLEGFEGSNYDKVQHLLLTTHFPALIQRLRSVECVKGICLYLPFTERAWLQLYQILPQEFRTNKTFLRIIFGRILPKEVLDAEKIGFSLPVDINRWQSWNLEIWKKGKSKINFWKN